MITKQRLILVTIIAVFGVLNLSVFFGKQIQSILSVDRAATSRDDHILHTWCKNPRILHDTVLSMISMLYPKNRQLFKVLAYKEIVLATARAARWTPKEFFLVRLFAIVKIVRALPTVPVSMITGGTNIHNFLEKANILKSKK